MHFIKAMDHAMSFVFGGLATWKYHQSVPLLSASDIRYCTPSKRKYPFSLPEGVPSLRSCTYNVDNKLAKYDLDFKPTIPCLCLHYDEGPKDLPAFWYLPAMKYRVLGWNDGLHRTSRDMQEAAKYSDVRHAIQDTTAALNYDRGPFLSQANFQKSVELATHFVNVSSPDCDLWCSLIDGMLEDDLFDTSADWGTIQHGDLMFKNLPLADCFQKLGEGVKWARWGSHHWALKSFIPMRHRQLLVLVVGAVEAGVKLSAITLAKLGLLDAPEAVI